MDIQDFVTLLFSSSAAALFGAAPHEEHLTCNIVTVYNYTSLEICC